MPVPRDMVPAVMAVAAFVAVWVVLALGVFFVAMNRGPEPAGRPTGPRGPGAS